MKSRLLLAALSLGIASACHAQNTYPWPATGNVGIGTTSPMDKLEVFGVQKVHVGVDQNIRSASYTDAGLAVYNDNNTALMPFRLYGTPLLLNPAGGGFVGVGTVSPDASFDVVGTSRFELTSNNNVCSALMNAGNVNDVIRINAPYSADPAHSSNAGAAWGIRFIGTTSNEDDRNTTKKGPAIFAVSEDPNCGYNRANGLAFYTNDFDAAATERIRISSNGNVGIGTANPSTKIDVLGGDVKARFGAWAYDNTGIQIGAEATESPRIGFHVSDNSRRFKIEVNSINTANERLGFFAVAGGAIPETEFLTLLGTGNVGIGTTSPTEKLSVKGKIRAQEVIVETTGWSDHVFADSYKLASLSEVEQHIKTEKHLPGVPSAQEVAEKGVSVGDMQAVLLAKIEELTLHQIAQEKAISALQSKVQSLETENAVLESPSK